METNAPEDDISAGTDSPSDHRADHRAELRPALRPVFRLAFLERDGSIDARRQGTPADSPDVALEIADLRLSPDDASSRRRLVVIRQDRLPGIWTDSKGNVQLCYAAPVVVRIVSEPERTR